MIAFYGLIAVERSIPIGTLNDGERKNILKAFLRSDFSHSLGLKRHIGRHLLANWRRFA
jgi:hypothetical protein